jgi:hypothetical protein
LFLVNDEELSIRTILSNALIAPPLKALQYVKTEELRVRKLCSFCVLWTLIAPPSEKLFESLMPKNDELVTNTSESIEFMANPPPIDTSSLEPLRKFAFNTFIVEL